MSQSLTPSEIRSGSDPGWISEGGRVVGWGRADPEWGPDRAPFAQDPHHREAGAALTAAIAESMLSAIARINDASRRSDLRLRVRSGPKLPTPPIS